VTDKEKPILDLAYMPPGSSGLIRYSAIVTRLKEKGELELIEKLDAVIKSIGRTCLEHGLLADPALGVLDFAGSRLVVACPWCSGPDVLARWEAQAPNPKEHYEDLLKHGMIQIVCTVSHDSGIRVPAHFYKASGETIDRFNLSWRFETPMDIKDTGIEAELSFNGSPFLCWFPWSCIVAVVPMFERETKPKAPALKLVKE
jgi:hypothetical protein